MTIDSPGLAITSLATVTAEHPLPQSDACRLAEQICCPSTDEQRLVRVLYRRAGVDTRFTAVPAEHALHWFNNLAQAGSAPGPTTAERMELYRRHAGPLALRAARGAIDVADALVTERLKHLVTVSCTGFDAPGVDLQLLRELDLRPTVERTNVGFMGCHGAINGLRVAKALAESQPSASVLLCAVELCSLHYYYPWDPEMLVGNAIFGDGAAALLGQSANAAGVSSSAWRVVSTGSCLLPDTQDAMSWTVGDHGFQMQLSPRVPELIGRHLRPWLSAWLDEAGLSVSQIGSWAIHPGGPRIVTAASEALGLPQAATEVSRDVLRRHGNMSSPTVLFVLKRLMDLDAPRPCVMLAFGPGLVAEAALIV